MEQTLQKIKTQNTTSKASETETTLKKVLKNSELLPHPKVNDMLLYKISQLHKEHKNK
jgi:hypothetical protein